MRPEEAPMTVHAPRRAAVLAAGAAGAALSVLGPLRNRLPPRLAGVGRPGHVALTFDDGPDPISTPRFLRVLEKYEVRATFFMLGSMFTRVSTLAEEIADAGHEIGIHGWSHRPLMLRGPRAAYDDLARAHDAAGIITGRLPRLFRPLYGIMTASAHLAARRLGLTPVLWTRWGEDWTALATPHSVYRTVTRDLSGGGTFLLHDSDCTSAPAAWQSVLGALPALLETCQDNGWTVGPLRGHGIPVRRGGLAASRGRVGARGGKEEAGSWN